MIELTDWSDEEMDLLAAEDADRLGWEGMDVYQDEHPSAIEHREWAMPPACPAVVDVGF